MLLKDYITNVDKKFSQINFSGIAFDSSKVKKNDIFFAIKGKNFNGNDYIEDAIKRGAKIVISEKKFTHKKKNVIFLFSLVLTWYDPICCVIPPCSFETTSVFLKASNKVVFP